MKRIMSKKKTILPSFRNQDWETVTVETEKINKLLTNNITILNELIYAEVKLVCEKIRVPLMNKNRMS